jgi:hypothetical protein
MLHLFKTLFVLLFFTLGVFAQHPAAVEQNLKKAGTNRTELEKAIAYCQKTNDSQKLKAIYFLIANMDIHSSSDYYWESKEGQKINYSELDYPNFDQAAKAFEIVKTQNPDLKPKAFTSKDLESIKGDFLIDNLEKAFTAWKKSPIQNISFDQFCEYLLPYRISVEPLQSWRTDYAEKFSWITEKIQTTGLETVLPYVKDDVDLWFTNTWRTGLRKEPLPRLGSKQLLFRKQGACPDLAGLGVFTMRAIGVPATLITVPYWATSTSGHYFNTFYNNDFHPIGFDYGGTLSNQKLIREPAKVLQSTYSKQATALANYETPNNIPEGYLRESNYIDVTQNYWQTTTVNCNLYPVVSNPKTVYLTTFNGLKWRPFWWGKIKNNQSQWDQICVGTIIIPHYYLNEKLIPAAPPILVSEKGNRLLVPNLKQLQPLTITSAEGYLLIKPNVTYKLYYWKEGWKHVDSKTATDTTLSLVYQNVPQNALLLLLGSDTKGFERPFVINEKGERTWY